MTWLLVAAAAALLVPLVTRGSYVRLIDTTFRHGTLLFLGLAVQVGLEWGPLPESRWHDVGFGLLVASYVLILGFCAGNLVARGMGVVLVGVACNFVAIVANQGMPVDVPPDWAESGPVTATVEHRPQEPGDRVLFLTDIIVLRSPFDTVLSFGDLIMAAGLVNVAYSASRVPRRRAEPRAAARHRRSRRGDRAGSNGAGHPARKRAERTIDLTGYVPDPAERPRDPVVPKRRTAPRAHPSNGFGRGVARLPGDPEALLAGEHPLESIEHAGVVDVRRR